MASSEELDARVRAHIFDRIIEAGRAPTSAQTSDALGIAGADATASYRRLADGRAIVLQTNGDIMTANPFAVIPTAFQVETAKRTWSAICIWDSLGIVANVKQDAKIHTACGDCSDYFALEIRKGRIVSRDSGYVHISVPARHWWDNIVFT